MYLKQLQVTFQRKFVEDNLDVDWICQIEAN